jgi:phage terminase large subunit-like protein
MSEEELMAALKEREFLAKHLTREAETNILPDYKPYKKQREFHGLGVDHRERLFMAGNQLGKTLAGAAEAAMHLTGLYPEWWTGRRWDRPIVMLAGSESYELTRDGVQRLLLGPPLAEEDWGTGFIPRDKIIDKTRRAGVSHALDTVTVRHASGGASQLLFKAYEQGRGKWQANTVDAVWFDEEPPEDVYIEGITRTNATKGMVFVTFTPLLGMSTVVARYLLEESKSRTTVTMTIDDAEHFTDEERAEIVASYPPHEVEARTKGIPSLGSGRIFPVAEEKIVTPPIAIPSYWALIGGVDFGWDHPFAAVKLAWDRDTDTIYVINEYRMREATPIHHAAEIRHWGVELPWSWPHDGLQHDKGSGIRLAEQYRNEGLNFLLEQAKFEDGSNGVEAGVSEMLIRMQTGRWKVFSTCTGWLEEFRLYHRKDGKIVKERDDLISASRYAMMMKRYAEATAHMTGDTWKHMPVAGTA